MHRYIPSTAEEKQEMLKEVGVDSIMDLFLDIPENLRLGRDLNLEKSKSEMEVMKHLHGLGAKNKSLDDLVCFLGAGSYDHFIPTTIKHLASRSEFFTAYTPYQPEISQGTLRVIFEYQSLMCNLTGMDASNASMYDGQTAVVEAALMAIASSKKAEKILVSEGLNPEAREVLKTYAHTKDIKLEYVALKNGATDMEEMASKMSSEFAGVIVQNPNFLGVIEDVEAAVAIAHEHKSLLIDYVDPMSLAVLKTPGEMGVDIAVGEAQTFGNAMNFGGPYLGFLTTTKKLMRKIPGRIAGETVDADGNRAFVLTLQAREQHIRRFKATSNICSNQGLNVLVSAIYMVTMGKAGIKEVAMQSMAKAHYAHDSLVATGKFSPAFEGQSFFREFAVKAHKSVSEINANLLENNYLGGYDLSKDYDLENTVLIALTEKRTKDEIDNFVKLMEV